MDEEREIDVKLIMERVIHDDPLDDAERHAVVACLMLWMMVPEHTRSKLIEGYLFETMVSSDLPISTAIN
jgi:hypothetical protein